MGGGTHSKPAGDGTDASIQLDMAPNSVDDMYDGCRDQMMKKLPEYLNNEKNRNKEFAKAWKNAEAKAYTSSELDKQHITAIKCYTAAENDVYYQFNTAVRKEGPEYKTTFGFHALHFLLTDAIQALKERRSKNVPVGQDGCVTSFRRVGRSFNGKKNTQFRFSSFTSSSWGKYIENDKYGKKTCFEIKTCFGEDISKYSTVAEEREVLIPPYEIFKVIDIKSSGPKESFPCEVEYKVKSAGK
ncbi:erythroblast NAD(P)(+)--arginine ADP-ribosyltransferase-like, partial [Plectropomus leopardus]|uniref:erythroblast NAD(P)(+)--arginine ADP-ribosyltransferase-like n=1 Tax=Plectropomus leopardus TaxID=160734 RepID=UPI001C4A77C7